MKVLTKGLPLLYSQGILPGQPAGVGVGGGGGGGGGLLSYQLKKV